MHNLKPKKHLGQHFLRDLNIARKIASCLQAGAEDQVVEIGPGEGVLTNFLVPVHPDLTLVEIDTDAAEMVKSKFSSQGVRVVHQDFLKWNMAELKPGLISFIGNLPYNVSSPIFFRLLEQHDRVKEGVFMVQKEVAERICSGPGNKEYGILSVLLGYYFDLKYEFTVGEKVFFPPPRVKSGVFTMRKKDSAGKLPFKEFSKVVKTAFGQRRKTLRNALKSLNCSELPQLDEMMNKRAEQLSVEDFEWLTREILNARAHG
ncbi:MAG: ribosomal RNA small subunit methyltransferase A [Bacteroidia bacterium]|nr:ribosomal RNA small subunit methyltransferase A [Bacteroidia bacterium]